MQSAFQSIEHTLDGIMFTTAVYTLNQGSFHRDKAKAVVQGVLIVRGLGYRVYHVRPCRLCFLRIKFHGYRNPPLSIAAFINRLRGLSLRLRQQGSETSLLQKSFNKFFSRHDLIVEKYGAALREMCAYNFILSAHIICLFI